VTLPPKAPTQRLFFALWPEEPERHALSAAVEFAVSQCGGRPVPAANLHVTLAFMGTVLQPRIPELQAIARECAPTLARDAPLSLTFTRLGYFRRPQVLCALAEDSPPLQTLAEALRQTSAAAGFTPDLNPFRAHVTLARKVAQPAPDVVLHPIVWRFCSFALIDSRTQPHGPVYSVVDSYSLVTQQKAHE
jgi:RNA 2',3'-cyclic 3'-phosphodiesterase